MVDYLVILVIILTSLFHRGLWAESQVSFVVNPGSYQLKEKCHFTTFAELIGVDETGQWDHCASLTEDNKLLSILTLAEIAGMSTGFVTTARVTHQSPSPLYAHSVSGDWESDKDKLEQAKDDSSKCPDIGMENTNILTQYITFYSYFVLINDNRIESILRRNITETVYK